MIVCENINKLQENTINQYDRITKKRRCVNGKN
jgi:hypothetical protein